MAFLDCQICFEQLESPPGGNGDCSSSIICLACGHLFHQQCIDQWHAKEPRKRNCPNCRAACKKGRIVHVNPDSKVNKSIAKGKRGRKRKLNDSSQQSINRSDSKMRNDVVASPIPAPVTVLKGHKALRHHHVALTKEHAEMTERYAAGRDEILLAAAKKQSLLDQKEKRINKDRNDQATRIQSLLRRPTCKCQQRTGHVSESDEEWMDCE